MAQGRSTKIITMIKLVRTSRLSMKNSLSRAVFAPVGHENHQTIPNVDPGVELFRKAYLEVSAFHFKVGETSFVQQVSI